METYHYSLLLCVFLLFSCNKKKCNELLTIPVNVRQNTPLLLSEITETLIAIDLELTDDSIINPEGIRRIVVSDNYVVVLKLNQILVFDKEGKFIRSIGRQGQGPGSFNHIQNIAIDEENKRIFILNSRPRRIISYKLNGEFLAESITTPFGSILNDINYVDNKLVIVGTRMYLGGNKPSIESILYRFDSNLQFIDNQSIRKTYFENIDAMTILCFCGRTFIMNSAEATYFYKSEIHSRMTPTEVVLRDTLFRLESSQLVPELRLRFRNDGMNRVGNLFIDLHHISRSSRYIFARYRNNSSGNTYQFVFDTKTGQGFNMQDGLIDDINNIDERIIIRPLNTNSEMFHFWHTHMELDEYEEPNPTLYIGRLRR